MTVQRPAVSVDADELDELRRDAARLNCLEHVIKSEPLLLHNNCKNNKGFLGLGMKCTKRTLRQAIDDMEPFTKPRKMKP